MAAAPKFDSLQDEVVWYKQKYDECQAELEEFQTSSKELELELETQLMQLEKENRDLKSVNQKLEQERDVYAEKFTLVTTELKEQLEQLDDDLNKERSFNEELQRHVRGLEQNNDDLERAKRALAASLEEFESRLNNAIERNAFLESELDEKEQLSAMVQRLKEETRDLKQELHVQKRTIPNGSSSTGGGVQGAGAPVTPEKKKTVGSSPSGRANALDIVNDLLRKVGTLMNVALTPPPTRRRTNSKKLFEANNNGESIREEGTTSSGSEHHNRRK
ncbi:nuclear distribution protein nudE-like 1 [Galendromus occidentalis]|uniref:Nuclear distribution protein nudE-like 1 n=1 Tax=Galendromus occidentalis TaxID=34638 RepID=A0AAJ6QQR1_9ACAR|nr:nuclear distribution protein nudE-like 1 [Galendromus occidentalis]